MAKKISGEAFDKKATSQKREKEIQGLVKDLKSSEEVVVLNAIEKVKHLGDPKMIPALIDVLVDPENSDKVHAALRTLLNQLKSPHVLPYLFEALEEEKTEGFRNEIVASIWESGLSPHDYLDQLVSLAVDEDYLTCLEVLTVVENLTELPSEDTLQENIQKINSSLPFATDKKGLLEGLAEVLQDFVMQ